MSWAIAIPVLVGVSLVSFIAGVRYTVSRMLPGILAKMTPLELGRLATQASMLRQPEDEMEAGE